MTWIRVLVVEGRKKQLKPQGPEAHEERVQKLWPGWSAGWLSPTVLATDKLPCVLKAPSCLASLECSRTSLSVDFTSQGFMKVHAERCW